MSLHNACSVIEKFGLSEGSLAFVFGALGSWIGIMPQFSVLLAHAATKSNVFLHV